MFEQASRILSICGNPLLIIENPLRDALKAASNKAAIYGALAHLAFSYGFKVFQTSDSDETAQLMAVIARHGGYGDENSIGPRGKRRRTLGD